MSKYNKRQRSEPAERTPPHEHAHSPLDWSRVQAQAEAGYPEIYLNHLACPFRKHDPYRYRWVKGPCTEGWGFPNIGKLNEHINRVHNALFHCQSCHKPFGVTKNDGKLDKERTSHKAKCEPRQLCQKTDPEVMTKEQQDIWLRIDCRKAQGRADVQKWTDLIYRNLFPDTPVEHIPHPFHRPGLYPVECLSHIISTLDTQVPRRFPNPPASHTYSQYNLAQGYSTAIPTKPYVQPQHAMNPFMQSTNQSMPNQNISSSPPRTYAQVLSQPPLTPNSHFDHARMRPHTRNMGSNVYGMPITASRQRMPMSYRPEDTLAQDAVEYHQSGGELFVPYVITRGPDSGFGSALWSDDLEHDSGIHAVPPFDYRGFPHDEDDSNVINSGVQEADLKLRDIGSSQEQALRRESFGPQADDDLDLSEDEE